MLVDVVEGQTFSLQPADLAYLRRVVRGRLEPRDQGWAVTRLVGHVVLPSGGILHIRSPKATEAAVLSWVAYIDPTLRPLQILGRLPEGAAAGDLAGLIARLFVDETLAAALRHGLLRRYARLRVSTGTVRGAIDFAQLSREGGALSHLPCVVWERVADTPLNHFLAAAQAAVARDPIMRVATAASLPALRGLLAGVRPAVDQGLLAGNTALPRQERSFELALALARLIVRHAGLGDGGDATGLAFLVNLETLFERTVVQAFRELGVRTESKAPAHYGRLAIDGSVSTTESMEMDLFLSNVEGGPVVVDAKYKTKIDSANLQQVVTYCFITGARRAVLVVPAGHVGDRRAYRFSSPPTGAGGATVRVDVVELDTSARDVAQWRTRARQMADEVLHDVLANAAPPIGQPLKAVSS